MGMMAIALPTKMGTRYFYFKTAGMGCSNSGPAWCKVSDNVLNGVPDVEKDVDDCMVQAKTEEEMLPKLRYSLRQPEKVI